MNTKPLTPESWLAIIASAYILFEDAKVRDFVRTKIEDGKRYE